MAHRCPRRVEGPFYDNDQPTPDFYTDGFCNYCGSMDGDLFMALCEAGDVELGPTDKNYKVYVENSGGAPFDRPMSKFYFQHLSDDQKHRFVDLLNAKTLKIGDPGHFYRLPFFIV